MPGGLVDSYTTAETAIRGSDESTYKTFTIHQESKISSDISFDLAHKLYINEYMANNSLAINDEGGEQKMAGGE